MDMLVQCVKHPDYEVCVCVRACVCVCMCMCLYVYCVFVCVFVSLYFLIVKLYFFDILFTGLHIHTCIVDMH